MATLNGNITSTAELIRVTGTPPAPGSYFTIDSEAIVFLGASRGPTGRSFTRDWWSVDRGVAGTTKATHSNGASLTRYYPDANGGTGGGVTVTDGTTTIADASSIHVPVGTLTDLGSGEGAIAVTTYQVAINLTHAQIVALSGGSIYYVIVPAPGTGKMVVPVQFTFSRNFVAPYVGGDVLFDRIYVAWATEDGLNICNTAASLVNRTNPAPRPVEDFFTAAVVSRQYIVPGLIDLYAVSADYGAEALTAPASPSAPSIDFDPATLALSIYGQFDSALSGGDAGNTMRVTADYTIVDVA